MVREILDLKADTPISLQIENPPKFIPVPPNLDTLAQTLNSVRRPKFIIGGAVRLDVALAGQFPEQLQR
jgi:hypothetical protein